MKKLITLAALLAFTVPTAQAEKAYMKDFEKKIKVPAVGDVRLFYRVSGEPVTAPARMEIWVKCKGEEKEQLFETVSMCHLTKYEYEKKVKLLTLGYVVGRVDEASTGQCDSKDEREFKLANICKDLKSNKSP